MRNALVTAIGSVSGATVIRGLKRAGYRVIGTDINHRDHVANSLEVHEFYQVPKVYDVDRYQDAIEKICKDEKIEYILPLTDPEVDHYSAHGDRFRQQGVTVCLSPKETILNIRNKLKAMEIVKSLHDSKNEPFSIGYIPADLVRDRELPRWSFPVVIKPYIGQSSQGRYYINNADEWYFYKKIADPATSIVQPHIHGPLVMVEIVRQAEHDRCVAITRKEILCTPHGCGLTVDIYSEPILEKDSKKLARELGINGCVNFEYIHGNDGVYYFVECNPRFSAGTNFSCLAGYDVIGNHMKCFADAVEVDEFSYDGKMTIARRYEEYITHIQI